jgi:predicted metalloprotease with PDZ domain
MLAVALLALTEAPANIQLEVDATQMPRCILRVNERLPVKQGRFAVTYPTWLPGNHRPSGPINDVVRFHAVANGREIAWTRDPINMYRLILSVPAGVTEAQLKFTVVAAPKTNMGIALGRLNWNRVVFLPDGRIDEILVQPSIVPPAGWTVFTALRPTSINHGLRYSYPPVSAEELVDSPAELGANARRYDLGEGHFFDVLTQRSNEADVNPEIIAKAKNLVAETGALFAGSRHYRHYDFLMTFSSLAGAGLEHHESSEDGEGEDALRPPQMLSSVGSLISHEMFHSWNGKHRRPAGLITRDFTQPHETSLLWVYEGMTQYYGIVLAARSGFTTPEQARTDIANEVGGMDSSPGRHWRPLADTAAAASILRAPGSFARDRRQQDYYPEAVALWLEADCLIRKGTNGKKSLDDFARAFQGGPGGEPTTIGYTLRDVERTLNGVYRYDWHAFFKSRVYEVNPTLTSSVAPSGWNLVYDDAMPASNGRDALRAPVFAYDLGLDLDRIGNVTDLRLDTPGDGAGLAPGDRITEVNGAHFSPSELEAAIRKAVTDPKPISLKYEREGQVFITTLTYHGGRKHPRLVARPGDQDYLADILKPLR